MVSTTGLPSGAAVATAKKAAAAKAAAKAKKPRAKPSHPRTSDMVDAAIKALKERGGSSLQAIKKYISATYKVDAEKLSPFIKRYLKSGVVAKKLVQTKGKGASGSFKLSLGDAGAAKTGAAKKKIAKKPAAKKPAAVLAKSKKSPVKKVAKKPSASPKKKVLKTLAAKPPKPKVSKPKTAKKTAKPAAARKPVSKARKAPTARK